MRRDVVALSFLGISAAAFYLIPWPLLYIPALLSVAALTWWRLDLAVVLVVVFSPFFMVPKHVGSKEFAPSEVFLLLDLLVAATYLAYPRRGLLFQWQSLCDSPFLLPGALFVVSALVSTILAADRHVALRAFREVILEPSLFFALLLVLPSRRRHWLLAAGSLAAAVVVGIVGLAEFATTLERVHSVYGSPDNVGLLYSRVLPLWLAVAALSALRSPWGRLWWAAGLVLVPVLILTWSRGAWLGVAVGCLFAFSFAVPWGRWVSLVCLVAIAGALLLAGPPIVQALRTGHANTVQRRLDIWRSSIRMIRDHPVFGVGPDNFLHYYAPSNQRYIRCQPGLGYMEPTAWEEPCLSHPHNEILDFWLSAGLGGLVAFFWLQIAFWRCAVRRWRAAAGSLESAVVLGAMSAMIAALVHGMVDNSYFLIDLAVVFWVLCTLVSPDAIPRHSAVGAQSIE